MIGASALYDETREKSESSVMTLGESDAVQQPSRRKQRPPEPKIPEETEPDPAIDPCRRKSWRVWQERSCLCCKDSV